MKLQIQRKPRDRYLPHVTETTHDSIYEERRQRHGQYAGYCRQSGSFQSYRLQGSFQPPFRQSRDTPKDTPLGQRAGLRTESHRPASPEESGRRDRRPGFCGAEPARLYDITACEAITAFRELGYAVPQDIARESTIRFVSAPQ